MLSGGVSTGFDVGGRVSRELGETVVRDQNPIFSWVSCEERSRLSDTSVPIVLDQVDICFWQGDLPYVNSDRIGINGMTALAVDKDSTATGDFADHYTQMMLNLGNLQIADTVPRNYGSFDDHEWGDDDWSNSLTENGAGISATAQSEINVHWGHGRTAWQTWANRYMGNANLTYDTTTNVDIPAEASTGDGSPSASDYPITYGRFTRGQIEFFILDCISYRTPVTGYAAGDRTMIGDQQEAWLLAKLASSSAAYKVVMTSKKFGSSGNVDHWRNYTVQRDAIVDAIDAASITGVVWCAGDHHWPAVSKNIVSDNDWWCVTACPVSVSYATTPVDTAEGLIVWRDVGTESSQNQHVYGLGYIAPNGKLTLEIKAFESSGAPGKLLWQGTMISTSNVVTETYDYLKTLHYEFDTNTTVADAATLGPTLSVTNSNGTYFDSDGVIQAASTNTLRFDHDPSNSNVALGILVEEARENVCLESATFATSPWAVTELTVTADQATAPDGTVSADELVESSNSAARNVQQSLSFTSGQEYTASVYAKKNTREDVQLQYGAAAFPANSHAKFDLDGGTVSNEGGGADSSSIKDVGNGWFLCTVTCTADATASSNLNISMLDGTTVNYAGDGSSSIYVWGAQVEAATFPTSYIPTTSASVTRTADVVSAADVTWLDAAQSAIGSFYIRGSFPVDTDATAYAISVDDGGLSDRIFAARNTSEQFSFQTVNSGGNNGNSSSAADSLSPNTEFKGAGSYEDDRVISVLDGTASSADTSALLPITDALTTLRIGSASNGQYWNGWIAEVEYCQTQKEDSYWVGRTT